LDMFRTLNWIQIKRDIEFFKIFEMPRAGSATLWH
jgi:hypothetical protein